MTTVREVILTARRQLAAAGIEDVSLNADLLAAAALDVDRGRLPLLWQEPAAQTFTETLRQMVLRRIAREPLQYILGRWGFLDFAVNVAPGVLIPRPETEEVFMAAADAIVAAALPEKFCFADVGTGTGILGLAMARRFNKAYGWLVDLSPQALRVAGSNLRDFPELGPRLGAINADLLSSFAPGSLHVIISNPPYIASADIHELMPEVRDFEPCLALDGGSDGLELMNKLLRQAAEVLVDGGLLIFEHGHGQRAAILEALDSCWVNVVTGDDLCGRERYFILQCRKG